MPDNNTINSTHRAISAQLQCLTGISDHKTESMGLDTMTSWTENFLVNEIGLHQHSHNDQEQTIKCGVCRNSLTVIVRSRKNVNLLRFLLFPATLSVYWIIPFLLLYALFSRQGNLHDESPFAIAAGLVVALHLISLLIFPVGIISTFTSLSAFFNPSLLLLKTSDTSIWFDFIFGNSGDRHSLDEIHQIKHIEY
ncbi:MAG: hypothetical protein ACYTER_09300 [Planctomycetota bacterium]|jgi:hypothetical protein